MSYNTLVKTVHDFMNGTEQELIRENANKNASVVSTHRDLLAGILSKHITINSLLPEHIAHWHESGYGHVHDTDYWLSTLSNCSLINYPDMLSNGFVMGGVHIETPKSIGVAATVLTQIIQSVANSQYGGQTVAHIDRYLAPYVLASFNKLLEKKKQYNLPNLFILDELRNEVSQAMQTFIYQCSTMASGNGQTAFITISLGLDTTTFGRMITEEYLKCHIAGLGKLKETPVFPKVIFMLQDGVNLKPSDPNYHLKKLAIECSVKRIYPDYISVPLVKEVTGTKSDATTPMGCRSFLAQYKDKHGKEKISGRMNLGVVSLNLPLYALDASGNPEAFFELLRSNMETALEVHMLRVNRLKKTKASHNPIMFQHGAVARLEPDQTIEGLFYDGRSSISIGFVGLAETVQILKGKQDKQTAMEILKFMKAVCNEFKERTRLSFSLYGTPAESLCYKFAKAIKEIHKESFEHDFLTNSFHQPVYEKTSPIDKWLYEEGFANICSGGFISYVEQPNLEHNTEAYEALVDFAYNHVPYYGINTPVDRCYVCGSTHEFIASESGFSCSECGNTDKTKMNVIRRVSGYLSAPNVRPFNKGKTQEICKREKHQ